MGWLILLGILIVFFLVTRFVVVKEGTARAIMTFGKFSKIIFQWKDHWMDETGRVLRKEEISKYKEKQTGLRIFGGLYLYGIWPIHRVHRYKHRWTDIRMRENGRMDLEFHEEELEHVLLKPAVYAIKLFAVETAPPERIPVDVLVLVTLRIENPYLFLFVAPPTPIEDVLARITAEMRAIITSYALDDLLKLRGESLWQEKADSPLKRAKIIVETLKKWGMKLADKGIEIKEIDLPPEYQKAAAAQREKELEAAGRAQEILGTVISGVVLATDQSEEAVQAEFKANPKEFFRKYRPLVQNTMTKLSMEEKAYLRIETPGATGLEGTFLRLIGAWQKTPLGRGGEKKEKTKESEEPFY